jgi:hypothetical protein
MIWLSLAIGFAGGLAVVIVGVPIMLWVLINHLEEETEALLSTIRGMHYAQQAPETSRRAAAPPEAAHWPTALPPGSPRAMGEVYRASRSDCDPRRDALRQDDSWYDPLSR